MGACTILTSYEDRVLARKELLNNAGELLRMQEAPLPFFSSSRDVPFSWDQFRASRPRMMVQMRLDIIRREGRGIWRFQLLEPQSQGSALARPLRLVATLSSSRRFNSGRADCSPSRYRGYNVPLQSPSHALKGQLRSSKKMNRRLILVCAEMACLYALLYSVDCLQLTPIKRNSPSWDLSCQRLPSMYMSTFSPALCFSKQKRVRCECNLQFILNLLPSLAPHRLSTLALSTSRLSTLAPLTLAFSILSFSASVLLTSSLARFPCRRSDASVCSMLTSGILRSGDPWICSTAWRMIRFLCNDVS